MRLPRGLSRELDAVIKERGVSSRSHWVANLIRTNLAEHGTGRHPDDVLAGTVTIVYRGAVARVRLQLAHTLSGFLKEVISSQHVFLQGRQSLEVLVVQGPAGRLHGMSDAIRKVRGVQQVRLTTTMALLPPLHGQGHRS
jgi:CopG family transcriptional regulator, nickel-responsive regulator